MAAATVAVVLFCPLVVDLLQAPGGSWQLLAGPLVDCFIGGPVAALLSGGSAAGLEQVWLQIQGSLALEGAWHSCC